MVSLTNASWIPKRSSTTHRDNNRTSTSFEYTSRPSLFQTYPTTTEHTFGPTPSPATEKRDNGSGNTGPGKTWSQPHSAGYGRTTSPPISSATEKSGATHWDKLDQIFAHANHGRIGLWLPSWTTSHIQSRQMIYPRICRDCPDGINDSSQPANRQQPTIKYGRHSDLGGV